MLTVGSLVPVVGWLVGVALLWASRRWTPGEKLVGTLVVPLGPGGVLVLGALSPLAAGQVCSTTSGAVATQVAPAAPGLPTDALGTTDLGAASDGVQDTVTTCSGGLPLPGWVVALGLLLALVLPVVVAVVLYRRAAARAALEPPVAPEPGLAPAGWTGLEIAAVVVLAVGGFVAHLVGPVIGLVLAWVSPRWTRREKVVATAVVAVPLLLSLIVVLGVLVAVFGASADLGLGGVGIFTAPRQLGLAGAFALVALPGIVAPLAAAGYLAARLQSRR